MGVKRTKHSESVLKSACVGTAVAIVATVIMAGVVGVLEFNEFINEDKAGVICYAVQALSVMIGCLLTTGKGRGGSAPITALMYCALLSATTITFFDGIFTSVIPGVLMIIAGMSLAVITKLGYKKQGNHFKRKVHSR